MFPPLKHPEIEVIDGISLRKGPPDAFGGLVKTCGWIPIIDKQLRRQLPLCDASSCVIGGSGTGKTTLIVSIAESLRDEMSRDDIMVVLVTKPSMLAALMRDGDKVINDPRRASDEQPYNILEDVRLDGKPNRRLIADAVARALLRPFEQGDGPPYFPLAAGDIIEFVTDHLADDPNTSNSDLREFLESSPSALRERLRAAPDGTRLVSHIEQDGPQAQGVVGLLHTAVSPLGAGRFSEDGRLSLRREIREKGGRAIFICVKPSDGRTFEPITQLMFDLVLKEALAVGERALAEGRNPGRVFVVLDEVRLLPRLEHLEPALNFGRELGLRVIIGVQNYRQLDIAYPEEAPCLISGCPNLFVFNVFDGQSREYIKGLFGRNRKRISMWEKYTVGGINETIVDGYVVEDTDLANLGVGECIVRMTTAAPQPFRIKIAPPQPHYTRGARP